LTRELAKLGFSCIGKAVTWRNEMVAQDEDGRKAGSLQNYGYSSAMKGADFVWDKEKLDRFIAKPDEVVPGNNMKPYGGLTSAEDRAKVIVFLESPTTN
jgi:cytochrome c